MGISTFPAPSTGGGGVNYKVDRFTTAGTWTAPSGVSVAEIFVVSGGGGGQSRTGSNNTGAAGGGGGGGGFVTQIVPITGGSAYTVIVGAGGAADAPGNTSSFGTLISVVGGFNGRSAATAIGTAQYASYGGLQATTASTGNDCAAGGGGGMFSYSVVDTADNSPASPFLGAYGVSGRRGINNIGATNFACSIGNPGVNGYGAGGGGGIGGDSPLSDVKDNNFGGANAGIGAFVQAVSPTPVVRNAGNAVANFGGGGGGGAFGSVSQGIGTATAGQGGSGYVEVRYWA